MPVCLSSSLQGHLQSGERIFLAPSPYKGQHPVYVLTTSSGFGVMSLANNFLHASWSFDCRVKLRNIIRDTILYLLCRNRSENTEKSVHFISNNSVLCKLILQLKALVFTMLSLSYTGKKLLLNTHARKNSNLAIYKYPRSLELTFTLIHIYVLFKGQKHHYHAPP